MAPTVDPAEDGATEIGGRPNQVGKAVGILGTRVNRSGDKVRNCIVTLGNNRVVDYCNGSGAVAQNINSPASLCCGVAADGAVCQGNRTIAGENGPTKAATDIGPAAALRSIAGKGRIGDGYGASIIEYRTTQTCPATADVVAAGVSTSTTTEAAASTAEAASASASAEAAVPA